MIISEIFYQEIAQLLNDVGQSVSNIKDAREQMRAFIVQLSRGIVEKITTFSRLLTVATRRKSTAQPKRLQPLFDGYVGRLEGNH